LGVVGFGAVTGVHGGQGGEVAAFKFGNFILLLDDESDFVVDAPEGEEVGADFGVGGAEAADFGFGDGDAEFLCGLEDFGLFFGGVGVDDDAANVVKEAGEERAFAGVLGEILGLRDAAGAEGDAQAVFPKLGGRSFFVGLIGVAGEGLQAEDEAADGFEADELDGVDGADDFAAEAELGGVDDLQKFGGDGGVLLDEFGDFVEG